MVKTQKESKYKKLLSKYQEIELDTLCVYSPEELTGEFKGVPLDSVDAIYFQKKSHRNILLNHQGFFLFINLPLIVTGLV